MESKIINFKIKYQKYHKKYHSLINQIGGGWSCKSCTFYNKEDSPICEICDTQRTGQPSEPAPDAAPAPDLMRQSQDQELERILRESKLQAQELERREQLQKSELERALQLSKQEENILEKYEWYQNEDKIRSINQSVIRTLEQLNDERSIYSEYEKYENQILESLFGRNKYRKFAYYDGPWKDRDLSFKFHNGGVYDPNIMLEHFKNGIIYSGITNYNEKARGTYITPEQALEDTKQIPLIFELNIVTMYIKLLLETNQRERIWPKLESPKDKLLWREIQKLFQLSLKLLIKLLKITITLPTLIDIDYQPKVEIDFNQDEGIIRLKKKINHLLRRNHYFKDLSSLIRDYIYPSVKYFLSKIDGSKILELYE
jgi:hypothetical protein